MEEDFGKRAGERGRSRFSARCSLLLLCLTLAGCKTAGFKETYMALDGTGNRRREHFFVDTERRDPSRTDLGGEEWAVERRSE